MAVEEGFVHNEEGALHSMVWSSCIETESGLNCRLRMRWGSVEVAVTREVVADARNGLIDRMGRVPNIRLVGE
jgi:hypothetical protein